MAAFPQDNQLYSPLLSPLSPLGNRARSPLSPQDSRAHSPLSRQGSQVRSQPDSHRISQLDSQARGQLSRQGSQVRSLLGSRVCSQLASQQRIQHFTKFQAKLMSMATTRHRIGAATRRCGSASGPTLMTRRPSFLFFFGELAGREATNSM